MKELRDWKRITRGEFVAFEEARSSGQFNMMTEANAAVRYACLDMPDYWTILKNYERLMEKFPGVCK